MIQAEDYDEYDIASHFPDAIAFLDRARASGGNALVHCNLGVNRSGAIVAAYMMVSEHKTLLRVVAELKAKRSLIIANVGFRRQLVRYARCRGYLDPVERKPPPAPSPSARRKQAVLEDIAQTAKSEKSAAPRSDSRVSLLNGEPKKNGYHRDDDEDDVAADQFPFASAAGIGNGGSADALQRYFKTKTDNGTGNASRYTTANVGDLVSAVRRERLLNDVDAAIEKMSRDDSDVSDCSSSNNFETTTKATSGGRATNGYHRVESASLLTDDYGVAERSRAVFDIDKSVSGSSGVRSLTSSDRLPTTNYYNRLDTSSVSNYLLPSRNSLSPSVQLATSASAPRLHVPLTNGDVHYSSSDWLTASASGSCLGRPLSAHNLNSTAASYLVESELPSVGRAISRLRNGGGATRRDRGDDDDDSEVISFMAEADRRANRSGACVSRARNAIATAARLGSERCCSVPDSTRSSSLLSTDDVTSWRPRRSYVGGAMTTSMASQIGGCSSTIGYRRYARTSSTPRLTTSRLLSEMTDGLVLDDISDFDDDCIGRRHPICGRVVPTRVTAAPSLRISSGSYLHI
jgi:hypothetical protein